MSKSHFYKGPLFKITREFKNIKTGKVTKRTQKDDNGEIMLFVSKVSAEEKARQVASEFVKWFYKEKGKEFRAYAEEWKPKKQKKVKAKRKQFAIQWGVNYLKLTRKGKTKITIDFYANPNKATLFKTKGEAQKMLDYIRWRGAMVNEVK